MTADLARRFQTIRATTDALAAPLSAEDQLLQATPMASPTKWHRAHTTWFFEAFVLEPAGIAPVDPAYAFLFNSYYDAVGPRLARPLRTLLSRPTALEVTAYRHEVDARVLAAIGRGDVRAEIVELGLQHEQQHQELILTDILHAFALNPIAPVMRPLDEASIGAGSRADRGASGGWSQYAGGVVEIGSAGEGFAYDNEGPRHRVYLQPFALADRPISVGELRAFIAEGGYQTPSLWLVDGFARAQAEGWTQPLHTRGTGAALEVFTLHGWRCPGDDEPASHLSFWEADAIARFLGGRLPTEAEWEHAAQGVDPDRGNFADGAWLPQAAATATDGDRADAPHAPQQLFGDVWEWTRSSYEPYPGYRPAAGALGEYNGKFMAQQVVLRGGSCLSPRGHLRASYRNFWPPETRFQMAGARLARDL